MNMVAAGAQAEAVPVGKPAFPLSPMPKLPARQTGRTASLIVAVVIAAVAGLSIFYLVRGEPLLVQGEVDATRFDIAARVDGRAGEVVVERGQNVAANDRLVRIENPEMVARLQQALAAKTVADAQLANIDAGTRPEIVAARRAGVDRAEAALVLAQKSYDRVQKLADDGFATTQLRDQATDDLRETASAVDQAKLAYQQAVNGYTPQEREIAVANVAKADADVRTVQSLVDQMVLYAPIDAQVYQRNVEPGEYVAPGVPLLTLIDLNDLWVHFDLREDLIKSVKVGDILEVQVPALGNRRVAVKVELVATQGEYASWSATRATGDFDLRTFSVRAYPLEKIPQLRPGMSAFMYWPR